MSRGSRRAKHRARQQAATQSKEHARRSAKDQYRQYSEDQPEPEFVYHEVPFDFGYEYVAEPERPPAAKSVLSSGRWVVTTAVLICGVAACWMYGYRKCMWACELLLAFWLLGPLLTPLPAKSKSEEQVRFTTEAEAMRFLQFVFSMYAKGNIDDAALAELLRKYGPPSMPEPCICEECRARARTAHQQQRQQHQQEYERQRRQEQAQQQQQRKRQQDQQKQPGDRYDKYDGMMGFGLQTLIPSVCPAVRAVLLAADYYAVLGLSSNDYSTTDDWDQQLRAARRRAALAVHPDKVGSSGHIAASRVNLAYETLSDDVARGEYDAYLRRCRRGG